MQKTLMALIAAATITILPAHSHAKGCMKGAVVGGAAGHVAGHHAVAGAVAGCVIQHHRENVRDKAAAQPSTRPNNPRPPAPGAPPST